MHKIDKLTCSWERESNNTQKDIPQKSLIETFLKNVKKNPDAPAIFYEGKNEISYLKLAENAARIAQALMDAGVRHGDKVAVSMPIGKESIYGVLGVLWCGGVYVPINCSQPIERRENIYKQSQIKYCITYSNSSATQITDCRNILIDQLSSDMQNLPEAYIADPSETAYIIFTSGSTGLPKGVEISHGAAWNTIADILERFEFTRNDIAIAVSALDFDLSVFDIFGMLSVGGSIAVLTEETHREPSEWIKVVRDAKVTIWNSVPALLQMFLLSLKDKEELENLRIVLISGDQIKPSLYSDLKSHKKDCRFIALGGATEASIWSNFFEVTDISDEWNIIPYGKPLSNQQFRVIHDEKDADDNVVGELWIGGLGLAKGYVSSPELTEKSFVYDNGKRWYKTGDLGYYMSDGNIIFVGRKDNQIKLNGFRIELGEIENHLTKLDYVNNVAVLVQEDVSKKSLVAALEIINTKQNNIPITSPVVLDEKNMEDCIVANFMQEVLYDNGKAVFNDKDLSLESRGIVTLWKKFLNNHVQPFTVEKTNISDLLNAKIDLFRNIISGEVPSLALLDDPLLAPAKLMLTPIIFDMVREIVEKVRKQIEKSSNEKVKVALILGKQGDIYLPFYEGLCDLKDKIQFTYFESSISMLNEAKQKYKDFGFETDYIKTDYTYLPSEFAGKMDIVVAINGLHLFTDISIGLNWVKLLLKDQGYLYASEAGHLTAMGLISAGVIEHGFTLYEKSRRNSSMLLPENWAHGLAAANLSNVDYKQFKNEDLYIFTAQNIDSDIPMDEEALKKHCRNKLVPYMIPDKFCYSIKFPLTNNGKVDKKSMLDWFSAEKTNSGTAPQSETEKKLAEIWCELFKIDELFVENNFFEIGGDSLLATRMLNSIRNCFGVNVSMKEIFDKTTLGEIAKIIDDKMDEFDLEEGEL